MFTIASKLREEAWKIKREIEELMTKLPTSLQNSINLAQEKGASSLLSTLSIEEHGFSLRKSTFRDALSLRYGWQPAFLPSQYVCGKKFIVDHAFSCLHGGSPPRGIMKFRTLQQICSLKFVMEWVLNLTYNQSQRRAAFIQNCEQGRCSTLEHCC